LPNQDGLMNEYILFDAALCQRFVRFLADRGLQAEFRPDQIEGFVVTAPDGLSDEVEQAIEDEYEALMAEQVSLVEAAGEGGRTLMRIGATLADGSLRIVQLPAIHGRRLFTHFSVEEIHDLVSAIAQSALNPVEGPICREL
jgi:hypothetical protein